MAQVGYKEGLVHQEDSYAATLSVWGTLRVKCE
jgi:hypothetical protein